MIPTLDSAGGSIEAMADNEPKPLAHQQLERADELIRIMRAARDGRDLTDYWRAEAELRSLLPPATEPLS